MADVKARRRTIFGMLQHQSVLRVLHKTLGLGELDRSCTFRLLSGQCLVANERTEITYNSSPARSRDCALYRGYLAMQHAMNAMHSAIVLHHLGCSVSKLREEEQLQEELPDDLVLRQGDSLADAVAMYGFGPVSCTFSSFSSRHAPFCLHLLFSMSLFLIRPLLLLPSSTNHTCAHWGTLGQR